MSTTCGTLAVANLDGSGSTILVTDQPTHFVTWLPPDGTEILFRGEHQRRATQGRGSIAIRPDGTGLRTISTKPPNNDFDFMSLTVSPDGSKIDFTRWSDVERDAVGRHPRPPDRRGNGAAAPAGHESARGARVLTGRDARGLLPHLRGRYLPAGRRRRRTGAATAPHSARCGPGTPTAASYVFTPDGTARRGGSRPGRCGATSGASRSMARQGPSSTAGGSFSFADTQRLAP